jgi:hypothetical protein
MKRFATIAAVAAAAGLTSGLPAKAQDAPKSVCFPSYQIEHTETPNDWTILFYMYNHKVWKAQLVNQCVGLRVNTRGFAYEPTSPGSNQICSNLLTVRLLDTGQTCLVGAITPYQPPVKGPVPPS